MANWGTPDYKVDPKVDEDAEKLRLMLRVDNLLDEWPRDTKYMVRPGYDRYTVEAYCKNNKQWQTFRESLKGKPTHKKLEALRDWMDFHPDEAAAKVQVGNYLGALRRGGQLDSRNRVRKWL